MRSVLNFFAVRGSFFFLKMSYTYAEQGVVIPYGIVRSVGAQYPGELNHGSLVVGLAVYESERTGCIADMNIKRYVQLGRSQGIPYAHIHDAVITHQPS